MHNARFAYKSGVLVARLCCFCPACLCEESISACIDQYRMIDPRLDGAVACPGFFVTNVMQNK